MSSEAAIEPPHNPARAERSILRREAKAASTTRKTWERVTRGSRPSTWGGRRLVIRTNPESTLGTGQKTVGGTLPTRIASAYHASLALGTP